MDDALGSDTALLQFVQGVRTAISEFESAGLAGGAALAQLKVTLDSLNLAFAERVREVLRRVEDSNAADAILRIASAARYREPIDELISRVDSFLAIADSSVKNRLAEEGQKAGPGLNQSRATIESALEELVVASKAFLVNVEDDV